MATGTKTGIFNLALALLMGAATAFAVFAMPADLFEALVGATGLPSLLSAAQPPLGLTARIAAMVAASLPLATLVWFGLRALDAPRVATPLVEDPFEDDWFAPRVRRADAHPDAPMRRPLMATEDVGEPLDELYRSARQAEAEAPSEALPVLDLDHLAELELAAETLPQPDPLELSVDQIDIVPAEITPDFANDEAEEEQVDWNPAPLHLHAEAGDEGMTTEELLARLPLPPHETASVSSLIQRLNAGLANAEWPIAARADEEEQADVDDRLRSVLQDLQKMAGGAGAGAA